MSTTASSGQTHQGMSNRPTGPASTTGTIESTAAWASASAVHISRARGLTRWLGSRREGAESMAQRLGGVLQLTDHGAVGDGRADLGLESGDSAGLVRLERLLHLHRLDHHHGVALCDLLALLDDDLDDRA